MQTLVVPLTAQLRTLLNTTTADASWMLTATLLAGAVLTPIAGGPGNIFGQRRMLVISLALLIIRSVPCTP
ncbi:hypothetical protein [Arthrobacter polaris]|uniref:hypothetical protein n=1 Tax=Arthrobacter polaris TaxID=2813727 RepID=UPI001F165DC5|nr:hypothetical protein [Arthrobacter polaris]UIK89110.1 hypothetical protein J0916_01025 [Arthrobacter polaris]